MLITNALNLQKKDMVVLIGGGGKTSIINKLAIENIDAGIKVIVTTTTQMYVPPQCNYSTLVLTNNLNDFQTGIAELVYFNDYMVVGRDYNTAGKVIGLKTLEIDHLLNIKNLDLILIEGDSAKGKSFKAPRTHEPIIPSKTKLVVPVIGVDCLGKPLTEKYFHSIDQIKKLTGLNYGEIFTEKNAAEILLNNNGYKKCIPINARWIPFINKTNNKDEEIKAVKLAELLKKHQVEKIIIGETTSKSPVKLVI